MMRTVEKKGFVYKAVSSQCQQTLIRAGKQACELLRLGDLNIQYRFFNVLYIHPYDALNTAPLHVKTS